jgi:hypothetical protein
VIADHVEGAGGMVQIIVCYFTIEGGGGEGKKKKIEKAATKRSALRVIPPIGSMCPLGTLVSNHDNDPFVLNILVLKC